MSMIRKSLINNTNTKRNVGVIYEDEEVIAFEDVNAQAPIHILIIPKQEIPTINDINKNDIKLIGKLVFIAKKIAIDKKIDKKGYRLVMNCNDDGGQSVFHIHLHLIGGRKMSWPPG